MKTKIFAALMLALCGSSFASQNAIRLPVSGMSASVAVPGATVPGGVAPAKPGQPGSTNPGDTAPPEEPIKEAIGSMPASVDFGTSVVGEMVVKLVTLTNTGTAELTLDHFEATGREFIVNIGRATTCKEGTPLAPSSSCNFQILWYPADAGFRSASLNVYWDTGMAASTLSGVGQALPPALSVVSAPPGPFGPFAESATTGLGSYQYTLKNEGGAPLTTKAISVLANGSTSGTLSNNTCEGTVQAGATCSFTLTPSRVASGSILLAFNETSKTTSISYSMRGESQVVELMSVGFNGDFDYEVVLRNPNQVVTTSLNSVKVFDNSFVDISTKFSISGCSGIALAPAASCTAKIRKVSADPSIQANVMIYYGPTNNQTALMAVSKRF